ncbi:unnamed protein product [Kuraishia capsulata CBS 1993]|uniref:Dynamin-type G domain-containing protein n=1 Tax=Kuraishia capsulata CBS 1993 TaxID=1382522 RepID=W6MTQ8_9ASCO|nr:uncharacterized protein KUCA_T00005857001 [Kuraishia capsulata CBS 1993]CDK29863.1 unnamed protein product [Kuraishia capsulata CBS 1993]
MSSPGLPHNPEDSDDAVTITPDDEPRYNPTQLIYNRETGLEGSTLLNGETNGLTEGSSSTLANGFPRQSSDLMQSHLQQLQYNEHRISLNRSIGSALGILGELRAENSKRPIFYPTDAEDSSNSKLIGSSSRLALIRQNSLAPAQNLIHKATEIKDVEQFELLTINLKLDQTSGVNAISSLDRTGLASLFNDKVNHVMKHLQALKERIDDTSSKVFVTGDLNSGKSAFCNALLRRRLLPEDQQPCTSVFCEVIDARDNSGVEEVHAVSIGQAYNRRKETSYKIFGLKDLEDLVYRSDLYSILKIYVNDNRPIERSLLKNGVIDISLIDAPGLNLDSYQTTQVFSRQEEIDLVVFVVNAENHFTLSGKEFIASAAHDKNLMFIVVNKFDNIKDQDKCRHKIMDQVHVLSPETYKDASEFVHFVSSADVLEGLPEGGPDGDADGKDDNDPLDYDSPEFDHLEASLRRFILEKRSISKLLPVKTYLGKLYSDLGKLCVINEKLYLQSRDDMLLELNALTPKYEQAVAESTKIHDQIQKVIESTSADVYSFSRNKITNTVNAIKDMPLAQYRGLASLYVFAKETQFLMINELLNSVTDSENYARKRTGLAVDEIRQIGITQVASAKLPNTRFKEEAMFTKKYHNLRKRLNEDISPFDFFDPTFDGFFRAIGLLRGGTSYQLQVWKSSASAMAVYSSTRVLQNGVAVLKNVVSVRDILSVGFFKKVVTPVILTAGALSVAYLVYDMPNAYQRKTARKMSRQVQEEDYQHANSSRIAKECRKVLAYPSRDVMNCLQTSLEETATKKKQITESLKNSDMSYDFYRRLAKMITTQKTQVESFSFEALHSVD